jgi:biotin transport system substrate-specific component
MIPLPFTPVPINLALLAVWLCGGLLGAKRGAIAIIVYILLGAIGAPVFHGFTGGVGVLAGPTGGYITGYLPAVIIFGLLYYKQFKDNNNNRQKPIMRILMTIIIGLPALAACYAIGTVWFIATTGTNIIAALMMCVVPFFPGDILKFALASVSMESLKKHGIIRN